MTSELLGVDVAGVKLASPLVLASGILGVSASSLGRVAAFGAGAVTTKSFSLEERTGHPNPTVVEVRQGLLNAVGLSNAGWQPTVEEMRLYKAAHRVPLFASVFGKTVEEYPEIAARAAEGGPDLLEVNVSCPNVAHEFGVPFEADASALGRIVEGVKKAVGRIPVSIKLSANHGAIGRMAKVCEEHGADAITAINTVGPGMHIDTQVRRPVLSNGSGGLSGPCILPIAVRAVWEIRKAVKLPIIGTGGVTSADDALQLILAGAAAVGIGSAVFFHGVEVFEEVNQGLRAYLERHRLGSLASLQGAAHA